MMGHTAFDTDITFAPVQLRHIHLVTGYLGSGKTQFLCRLLERPLLGKRIAVIVNDFGMVTFDGVLLSHHLGRDGGVQIVEVPGGCLCCSALDTFQAALQQVLEQGAQRIFIEATGLAHAEQVRNDLALLGFPLESTFCIVDAVNLWRFQTLFHVVNAQIRAADILCISKADMIKPFHKPICAVEQELRRINSRAVVQVLDRGAIPMSCFVQIFAPMRHFVADARNAHQEYLLRDGITAFRLRLPANVDDALLEEGLARLPTSLVRLKGIVQRASSAVPVLLNYIAGAWEYVPMHDAWDMPHELFAIGQNVRDDEIRDALPTLDVYIEPGTVRALGIQ
ncbi:MAG: GTP-binding protein [Bacteroidota bacterium]|nr:GTP-binding protein [Candidatus Kapabacteria bacterium]MDW8219454.1 GTP-binding protein [Bacteroidota bacterium]